MNSKIHVGNLVIDTDTVCDYTEVTGYVSVYGTAKLDAPVLTTVGGYVCVHGTAKLDALTTVGGDVSVYGTAKLDALTTVGGYVSVYGTAKLDAPRLKTKNDSTAAQRCKAILMAAFAAAGFSFADGILARMVSTRGNVSRVIIIGKTKISYLVTYGEVYSHGDTLKQARDGLLYKIRSRDTTEFKAWKLSKKITKRDAIRAYRTITGACESGVRQWMDTHKAPEAITIKGIIKLTQGAFGNEVFKKFFGEGVK
jgi:hypothetical protein